MSHQEAQLNNQMLLALNNKKLKKSFSLIEVLIFVTILTLFFIVAAAVIVTSLRNMKINEHKILATRYAEELMEWLRSDKETDWGGTTCTGSCPDPVAPVNFTERATKCGTNACTFCFNTTPISEWPTSSGTCAAGNFLNDNNNLFKREVVLTSQTTGSYVDKVEAAITVSWSELGNSYHVNSNSVFTIWEH